MTTGPDRLAIVTGTSSGIGEAAARELLRREWSVIGAARRAASIEHPHYRHLIIDLQDLAALEPQFERDVGPLLAGAQWRRIGLVNNAADSDPLGPLENATPSQLQGTHAVNLVAPIWLMGFVIRRAQPSAVIRIVNVSSGAATSPFPGLGAYASTKAGLRMAGMVFAKELDSPLRPGGARPDATIFSYEPGIVDTAMQTTARERTQTAFPWVGMFTGFQREGMLVSPSGPAREMADYLESTSAGRFTERRFAG